MISEDFPIGTKSITFTFNCPNCGAKIQRTTTKIPVPNWNAHEDSDSRDATMEQAYFDFKCPKCHKPYSVTLTASSAGGEIYSDDLPDDTEVIFEKESED